VNDVARDGALNARAVRQLQVEFITDPGRVSDLAAEWEALNERLSDHEAPFFQSHAWNLHVARVRLQRSAHRYRPCVAVVREYGVLVGLWPLSLQRTAGTWIAKSLDDPFGQFAGIVFATAEDIAPGVAATIAALKRARVADGLQLSNVIEGSALHRALLASGARTTHTDDAIYVDMRDCASFEVFSQSVNKKTRKNLRNLLSRLKRATGDVEHTVTDDRSGIDSMLTRAFEVRLEWMQTYARTSPAFRDADFRPIVEGLAQARGISILGFSLSAQDAALSTQWGFHYLGRYYAYMSGKNSRFDAFSPGRLHLGMVIEACKSRAIDVVEMMAPASDYKLTWSDRRRPLHMLAMPFTFKGYVLLEILMAKIVPATRTAARLLPHALRRRLLNPLLRNRADPSSET
jgi:CelD/BcsL family acetyltransferase involved in cellulose biosynthesis